MLKRLGLAIVLVSLAGGFSTAAQSQGGVRVGTLTCNVASGWGFVFGSSKALHCTFAPAPGRGEYYAGTINKFGVDIGYTQGGVLVWAVFAPTADLAPGGGSGFNNCGEVLRVNHSRHPHARARGARRRFQIAVSFFGFSGATPALPRLAALAAAGGAQSRPS